MFLYILSTSNFSDNSALYGSLVMDLRPGYVTLGLGGDIIFFTDETLVSFMNR